MNTCYYCGAPLPQTAAICIYCGSTVDPLDIPLCDSDNSILFDEAPILQMCEVKYPPLLHYEDDQAELSEDLNEAQTVLLPNKTIPEEIPAKAAHCDYLTDSHCHTEKPNVYQKETEGDKASPEASQIETNNAPISVQQFSSQLLSEQDQTCIILKYLGGLTDVLPVPEKIDGLQVSEIARSAFAHCLAQQIVLPDSLIKIGDYAFTGCMRLHSVTGGSNVREIGRGVFNGCLRLKRCDFLKNHTLHRPFDSSFDRIMSQLSSAQNIKNGESS